MIILDIVLYIILILIVIGLCYIIYIFVYDYIVYKINNDNTISSTSTTIDKNIKNLDKNINSLNNDYSKKLSDITNNYNNTINSNVNVINSNIMNLSSKEDVDKNNLLEFDKKIKNYFNFSGNTVSPGSTPNENTPLYNYIFDTNVKHYNLTMLKNVNAASGMTIKTNPTLTDPNNFRICDNSDKENCVNLNVDAKGNFNISPENINVNKIKMYNSTGTSLATFDFNDNSIRLGESSTTNDTALYVKDNNVYVKNLKLVNPTYKYTTPITTNDYSSIDNNTLSTLMSANNVVLCSYQIYTSPLSISLTLIPQVTINATNSSIYYIYLNIPEISSTGSINSISLSEPSMTITAAIFVSNYAKSDKSNLSYLKLTVVNTMYAKSKTTVTIESGFSVLNNINSSSISIGYIDTI
jgi:hypothetical protein